MRLHDAVIRVFSLGHNNVVPQRIEFGFQSFMISDTVKTAGFLGVDNVIGRGD